MMIWVFVQEVVNAIMADAFVTLDLLEKHVQPPLDVQVIVPAMALATADVVNVKLVLWAAIAIQRN
jgi:hypothetical protein